MAAKLLPDEISRQMRNIYNNMKNYGSSCVDRNLCKGMCCLQDVSMTYVEFAYLADYLAQNFPEERAREILTRDKTPFTTQSGRQMYFCKIHEGTDCLGYPARPFRCRSFILDEKRDLCRYLVEQEMDHKFWRRIWRLDDSATPIPKAKRATERENDLDFWVKEILEY